MTNKLKIDGSSGEGGGQILRTALGLSATTGKPFSISKLRAGRKKPGLLRQHLTGVLAAKDICNATVTGAELGSTEVTFAPGDITPGDYHFAIGTAGSTSLVLQAILPAILSVPDARFTITLEGGTHNAFAPPFEFLDRSFFRVLRAMGVQAELTLVRPGFYPAGGGRFEVEIETPKSLTPIELLARDKTISRTVRCVLGHLSEAVADREFEELAKLIDLSDCELVIDHFQGGDARGPGNALLYEFETADHCTIFSAMGGRYIPSERVAKNLANEVKTFLPYDVPVDEHLADQLLIPMALAGGGAFRSTPLSQHTTTNMETIKTFLEVDFEIEIEEDRAACVRIQP